MQTYMPSRPWPPTHAHIPKSPALLDDVSLGSWEDKDDETLKAGQQGTATIVVAEVAWRRTLCCSVVLRWWCTHMYQQAEGFHRYNKWYGNFELNMIQDQSKTAFFAQTVCLLMHPLRSWEKEPTICVGLGSAFWYDYILYMYVAGELILSNWRWQGSKTVLHLSQIFPTKHWIKYYNECIVIWGNLFFSSFFSFLFSFFSFFSFSFLLFFATPRRSYFARRGHIRERCQTANPKLRTLTYSRGWGGPRPSALSQEHSNSFGYTAWTR